MFAWLRRWRARSALLKEVAEVRERVSPLYHSFTIGKSDGRRRDIEAPVPRLKALQRTILKSYLYGPPPSPYACAFVRGRSTLSAAKAHSGKAVVVAVDIKDFFPSITRAMVDKALIAHSPELAERAELREAVLWAVIRNSALPQGAPTSPTLSNLVFRPIDFRLAALAKSYQARFSRYADDLYFSSSTNTDLAAIIKPVREILKENGFSLNTRKVRVMHRGHRQVIAGIVVNDQPTIGRAKLRALRAAIHALTKDIAEGRTRDLDKRIARLRGQLSYYQHIAPSLIPPYRVQLERAVSRLSK